MPEQINSIKSSWNENAKEWIALLNRQGIPSRKITNKAILSTALQYCCEGKVLDLGCGEGWLTRALGNHGIDLIGVDATLALIDSARLKSNHPFHQISYEEIVDGKKIDGAPFQSIICNYCLYKKEETAHLIKTLPTLLNDHGRIIIQTVHPFNLCKDNQPYQSRWIDNAWHGLDGNFTAPHAWYARSISDWISVFHQSSLVLEDIIETTTDQENPLSVIFVAKK